MHVAMLISGGVDSSVALALLKEQGYLITAFYLKIWLEDELAHLGTCPWEEDLLYAQKTCDMLNIPLQIIPLQKEYYDFVVTYTINEIKNGNTPNPDIFCNTFIKFGAFYDAVQNQYDKIATGHYAGITSINNTWFLTLTPDAIKDQTYFLSRLTQEQLSRVIFPLHNFTKEMVRDYAQQKNLPSKIRKDSQGLCFLGNIKFHEFIKHHVGIKIGNLIEYETQKIMGTHEGFWFYTIGQRYGIKLSNGPWYVVKKDIEKNIIYISKQYQNITIQRMHFFINDLYWFNGIAPTNETNITVKIRHGAEINQCTLKIHDENTIYVELKNIDQGIAPGQFAVFYKDNLCLGSGKITNDYKSLYTL